MVLCKVDWGLGPAQGLLHSKHIPSVILKKWGDPWGKSLKATHFSFLVEQSMGTSFSLAEGSVERV